MTKSLMYNPLDNSLLLKNVVKKGASLLTSKVFFFFSMSKSYIFLSRLKTKKPVRLSFLKIRTHKTNRISFLFIKGKKKIFSFFYTFNRFFVIKGCSIKQRNNFLEMGKTISVCLDRSKQKEAKNKRCSLLLPYLPFPRYAKQLGGEDGSNKVSCSFPSFESFKSVPFLARQPKGTEEGKASYFESEEKGKKVKSITKKSEYLKERNGYFIPDFVEIQRKSFFELLENGLIEEFSKRNPITNKNLEIFFYPEYYQLTPPEYNPRRAILISKSYSSKLFVPVQLTDKKLKKCQLKWVLIGNLPLMTKRGHFVLNGSPRVIVNQILRSPGIYFQGSIKEIFSDQWSEKPEITYKRFYTDLICLRGTWLRIEVDKNKDMWAQMKKVPKIPLLWFLLAMGLTERIIFKSVINPTRLLANFNDEIKRKIDYEYVTNPSDAWKAISNLLSSHKETPSTSNKNPATDSKEKIASDFNEETDFDFNKESAFYKVIQSVPKKISVESADDDDNENFNNKSDNHQNENDKNENEDKNADDNINNVKKSNFELHSLPTNSSNGPHLVPFTTLTGKAPKNKGKEKQVFAQEKEIKLKKISTASSSKKKIISKKSKEIPIEKVSQDFFVDREDNIIDKKVILPVLPISPLFVSSRKEGQEEGFLEEKRLASSPRSFEGKAGEKTLVSFLNVVEQSKEGRNWIFKRFMNPRAYDLGSQGRLNFNRKLGLSISSHQTTLTAQDVLYATDYLLKVEKGLKNIDDIDHLKNRRVRTSGELLQIQIGIGLVRLEKILRDKLSKINAQNRALDFLTSKPNNSKNNEESFPSTFSAMREGNKNRKDLLSFPQTGGNNYSPYGGRGGKGGKRIFFPLSPYLRSKGGGQKQRQTFAPNKILLPILLRRRNSKIPLSHGTKAQTKMERSGFNSGPLLHPLHFAVLPPLPVVAPIPLPKGDGSRGEERRKKGEEAKGVRRRVKQALINKKLNKNSYAPSPPFPIFASIPLRSNPYGERGGEQERDKKKQKGKLLSNVTSGEEFKMKNLINTKAFNGALREFFGSSQLSQFMDQLNPLAEITHKRRLSSMGPGGVTRDSATLAIRGIHPTHYGRICPIETPEGKNTGLVNSLTTYARANAQGFLESPFYKVYKGQVQKNAGMFFLSAEQEENIKVASADVATPSGRLGFLPKNKIPAKIVYGDTINKISRNIVEYIGVSPIQMISIATSLIPFLEHDDANRALMGSNMQRQAVPLVRAERPLVGTGLEARAVSDSGHAVIAKESGYVAYISGKKIVIYTIPARD